MACLGMSGHGLTILPVMAEATIMGSSALFSLPWAIATLIEAGAALRASN